MKNFVYLIGIVLTFTLSGCRSAGNYVPTSSNVNSNTTNVVLSGNNFYVVGIVQSSVVYKNGNMKFDRRHLKESAYAALLREANLQDSQALINVTFEHVKRYSEGFWSWLFGLRTEDSIIASGVVIEFTK